MRDVINQSTIWKFVGSVSAINGLVCFGLSSTYEMSFGKWGFRGLLAYLLVGLIMLCLILWAKRIRVSQKVQGLVAAVIFDAICLISVLHDELVTGKSDALSIISYGSFALMSLSMSRKFELGFETGFSSFFLSLFVAHLFKINRNLLPIALVFCSLIIILRHSSESRVQLGRISPYHHGHPNATEIEVGHEDIDEESQDSAGIGEVSGQSLLSTSNWQNNQEVSSYQATQHYPRIRRVSDWDNEQNNEQEDDPVSLPAESWDQDHVSSANNMLTIQNSWMHSSPKPGLISSAPPLELLRYGGRLGEILLQYPVAMYFKVFLGFAHYLLRRKRQLNTWQLQVPDGTHSINPRLMYDPSRRAWLLLEEAALVFRMVEEADLELTMRPEMRVLVKPQAADSADDSRTSSPTSVLQLRTHAEAEEEEEEEPFEECQGATRI